MPHDASNLWKRTEVEESAFQASKQLLLLSDVLVHYDPKLELALSCDATSYGVGTVLRHGDVRQWDVLCKLRVRAILGKKCHPAYHIRSLSPCFQTVLLRKLFNCQVGPKKVTQRNPK